ncbi:MAG: hypothetical protein M3R03_10360 [Pseudomonadota bacterium]|nr:hypothetical protein [Pseudomonadota bacterium]
MLTTVTLPAVAVASTPTLMWTGAKRVNLLCNVAGGPGIDHIALTAELCRHVMRIAVKGAPVPVRTIAIGDPAVLASDAVTLLVHASVGRQGQEQFLAFSVRPYRSSDQAAVLFGAAPRVAKISSLGAAGVALDAALLAALSETLPWLTRPQAPQPIIVSR